MAHTNAKLDMLIMTHLLGRRLNHDNQIIAEEICNGCFPC